MNKVPKAQFLDNLHEDHREALEKILIAAEKLKLDVVARGSSVERQDYNDIDLLVRGDKKAYDKLMLAISVEMVRYDTCGGMISPYVEDENITDRSIFHVFDISYSTSPILKSMEGSQGSEANLVINSDYR